jgi:hypothetical protein
MELQFGAVMEALSVLRGYFDDRLSTISLEPFFIASQLTGDKRLAITTAW